MELAVALPLHLKEGLAEITFPEALKRDPLQIYTPFDCLWLPRNMQAHSEGFFLVCSASIYRDKNLELKKNTLGLFKSTQKPSLTKFREYSAPLTLPQETIQNECVNFHGKCQNVSALGVVHIRVSISNKLLAI